MKPFLRQWQQSWRIAEMRLLFLALLVSVIAISAVGFFTDRADKAMSSDASQLMGGDLVLSSSRPIDTAYLAHAKTLGLRSAESISFPSMVSANNQMQLAQIKAVSKDYPLTGTVKVSDTLSAIGEAIDMQQLQGQTLWAQARLWVELGINTSTTVQLGQSTLQLTKIITEMPDQGTALFQFAPQVLLSLEQLPATGLLSPASRASYSHYFAGDLNSIEQFKQWLTPQLSIGEKIHSLDEGLPAVEQALNRGKRFLGMAALLSVILAGAAIALSSYSFNQRETRSVAVLKTLGASRNVILQRYLVQLGLIATLAAVLGVAIAYSIQATLLYFLQDSIGQSLPPAGFMPVISGFLTAYIMALGFSAPQLWQLTQTAPVQIFQQQQNLSKQSYRYVAIPIIIGTMLLMWLQTHDLALSLFLLVGTIIAVLVFWLIAIVLLKALRRLKRNTRHISALHLPKANPRIALLVVVFGVGLFSLLLLTTLRIDLIDRWQASLPHDAPNHFLINIQANERDAIQQLFAQQKKPADLYPMILGRLVKINNAAINSDDYESERAKRLLAREFSLSTLETLPDNNKITQGQWFDKSSTSGLSLEEGIAKTLHIKIGDSLSFDMAGQIYQAKITSLRSVRWDSMKPNFFVLAAPNSLNNQAKTYITSVYVNAADTHFIPDLIKQYPSISDIDIAAVLKQIKNLINKAAFAVQAIFAFTLIAGIIVLFAALQSQKAERRKEIAILKSLGASRRYLRNSILIEFTLIGAIAGFIAAVLAVIAGNVAAYLLFDLAPSINLLLIAIGISSGALLVGVAGYLNIRPLLQVTPVALFQERN
jgi:putative ABC transport system permease protein